MYDVPCWKGFSIFHRMVVENNKSVYAITKKINLNASNQNSPKSAQKSAKTYELILFLITTHLWVIQIWVIPHSKVNTRICLKWKDHLGLTTWWRSRANWKKYIISLYSATTWVDRFDFFTEYRLRHVWLIYDVIWHDS